MSKVNKKLILKQTPAGLRWYDPEKGRYVKIKKREYQVPEGLVSLYKEDSYFKIEVVEENRVITYEGLKNNPQEVKTVRDFEDKESSIHFYRKIKRKKIKEGFREWSPTLKDNQEDRKVKGKWGSYSISKQIKLFNKKGSNKKEKVNFLKKVEVPIGYVEFSREFAERFEKIVCHLAEFMKQSKRTKAIRDIRNNVTKIQLYKSIQYKVYYALDQFEGLGIDRAKWALKKNHRISKLIEPSNDGMVIIKATNLKIILESVRDMINVLKGLLIYYDPRTPEEVKLTKRKSNGRILLRPKRVTVQRFFREGAELYHESLNTLREFAIEYPEIAKRVIP